MASFGLPNVPPLALLRAKDHHIQQSAQSSKEIGSTLRLRLRAFFNTAKIKHLYRRKGRNPHRDRRKRPLSPASKLTRLRTRKSRPSRRYAPESPLTGLKGLCR
ncbi:hypothetical protein OEZ66_13365, partial [Escherichia coli]|nr:hypothetical protein [Escherichia coli]